jgi:hypothetical protein
MVSYFVRRGRSKNVNKHGVLEESPLISHAGEDTRTLRFCLDGVMCLFPSLLL